MGDIATERSGADTEVQAAGGWRNSSTRPSTRNSPASSVAAMASARYANSSYTVDECCEQTIRVWHGDARVRDDADGKRGVVAHSKSKRVVESPSVSEGRR
jgi:hypothetical protein